MTGLLVELRRQAKRRRTLFALVAILAIPVIVVIALKVNGGTTRNPGEAPNLVDVATASGLNYALFALLATSQFLLVVIVALFAGDTVASEASWGSLRYLLTRPIARGRLLRVKLTAAVLYGLLATVLIPLVALAVGSLAFGWHGVLTPFGSGLGVGTGLTRLAAGTAYVAADMAPVVALAFLLSTVTDAPLGAVGGAVVLLVVSQILDAVTALGVIRYGLPTHYWLSWTTLLEPGGNTAQIGRGLLLDVIYTVLPLTAAWWWFARKDILS